MVRSTRRISTKTGHQIRAKLLQVGYHVSYGTVLNYKPFYVQKPCEREKESCLCKFCLNLRLRYNEMNKILKDKNEIEESMTKYFSNGCTCEPSENGFVKLECITGTCSNCQISPLHDISAYDEQHKIVRFHQFVVDEYTYISKKKENKNLEDAPSEKNFHYPWKSSKIISIVKVQHIYFIVLKSKMIYSTGHRF